MGRYTPTFWNTLSPASPKMEEEKEEDTEKLRIVFLLRRTQKYLFHQRLQRQLEVRRGITWRMIILTGMRRTRRTTTMILRGRTMQNGLKSGGIRNWMTTIMTSRMVESCEC